MSGKQSKLFYFKLLYRSISITVQCSVNNYIYLSIKKQYNMSKNIVMIPTNATPSTFLTEVKGTKPWKACPQWTQSGSHPQKRTCPDPQPGPRSRQETDTRKKIEQQFHTNGH